MENAFGATSTPAHSRAVEPHAEQVAYSAFACASGNVQIVTSKVVIAHAMAMLAEVFENLEQLVAFAFVTRSSLGNRGVRARQRRDYLVGAAAAAQIAHALTDPGSELRRAFAMEATPNRP